MKSLFKAGATISVGFLLSVNTVSAANIRPQIQTSKQNQTQAQNQNQISLQREFAAYQSRIKYLSQTLSLAGLKAAEKPQQTVPEPLQVPKSEPAVEINQLFPANTPYLLFVSTQSQKWQGFKGFHLYKMAENAIAQFAPTGINFDYQRDVESWLGEQIILGFLPKRGEKLATLESSYIAVVPIRDQNRTDLFLGLLASDSKRVKSREYKGVKIYEITTPSFSNPKKPPQLPQPAPKALPDETLTQVLGLQSQTLAIAALPGYIVGGLSGQAVEKMIDNLENPRNTLSQNPDYQQFWQEAQKQEILISAYQNPVETMVLYQDFFKDPKLGLGTIEIPKSIQEFINPEKYKKYRFAQVLVKLQPEGIRMQAAIHEHPNANNKQLKADEKPPIPVIGRMPGATYSTLTSNNFSLQWQAITQFFSSIKEWEDGLNGFREFVRNSTGLDLDKDIIGWIDGDYGLFSFPTKGGFFNTPFLNFNIGLGFVAETKQADVATTTIKKLEELIKSSGEVIKVKNKQLNGQPVTSWELDNQQSVFAYSWLNPNTIIMTTGYGAIAELIPAPRTPLNTAYNFTTATNSLPKPNQGYFYINMGSSLSWIYGFVPQEFQSNEYFRIFKEAIGSIYSISSTNSLIPNGEQFDSLIVLAPNRSYSPKLRQK